MNYDLQISQHWADQAARKLIREKGDRTSYTVASGITPSGTVHIGNFREVITVDLVARALQSMGKKVRFIYSWDNFDTFRKVPKNFPNQEMLKKYLRQPISRIPDPFEGTTSYAAHNMEQFEAELSHVGIKPEFLNQEQKYGVGTYAEAIKTALESRDKIREILERYRSEPLPAEWLPTSIYCESCQRDEMEYERYPGGWEYGYKCSSCGHEAVTDIRKTKNLKLNWRTDWPMRWAFEKVDFEPGGKDHSSEGGSFDTAQHIVRALWNHEPPTYLQYDFVMIKGGAGKMSSSSGELFTLSQVLSVYTPQMVRWIFASQRPNHDFALAFDSDVIKAYEEFDRLETLVFLEGREADLKWVNARRTYELSAVGKLPDKKPFRPPFRDLCNHLQICDGDISKTRARYYSDVLNDDTEVALFNERAEKAWAWVESYAPEDFRYRIFKEARSLPEGHPGQSAIPALKTLLNTIDLDGIDPKALNEKIYADAIHGVGVDPKAAFSAIYQKLIGRDQGPRLPTFLKEIGKERLLDLL